MRLAGLDGRGERAADLGLPAGDPPNVHDPRMSGGRLAFIAGRNVYVVRPGHPAEVAVDDPDTLPVEDDTTPRTHTEEIDFEGDVLLELRHGSSVGSAEQSIRVRRLGRAPATLPGTSSSWDAEMQTAPLLGSAQLEGGRAYWVSGNRIGRAAPAVRGRVTSAPRGAFGPLVAVGGTQVFAARKLRSGGWTVVAIPPPRFRAKG